MSLAYYITAHGYGHGTRSCDILRAVRELDPALPITVISDLPREFLASRLPGAGWSFLPGRFDVGMVQRDSIKVDVAATLAECRALLEAAPMLQQQQESFLRSAGVRAVVSDIPAIPLAAARACGLPALAVGNFAWDWIYDEFAAGDPAWRPAVDHFRQRYALCDLLLRLPFAEPMSSFPRKHDIGVPARPGTQRRADLAARTGADPAKPWVLLSFTSLDWSPAALDRVLSLRDWDFFTVRPLAWAGHNLHAVDRREIPYSDVLASCDVVLTKPGFGVLAECAVNDKPMIFVERTDFREYPILEAAVRRHFRHAYLPAEQLYRGELREALEAVAAAPTAHHPVPAGGDRAAARIILDAVCDGRVSVSG